MSANNGRSGGVGILGLLGVAFVVLKLTGDIDWNWVWVLAPFWAPAAFVLAILAIVGTVMIMGWCFARERSARR